MATAISPRGVLRVVSPDALTAQEQAKATADVASQNAALNDTAVATNLGQFVEKEFDRFSRHRDSPWGWTDRINQAMRMFKGEYEPDKLQQIQKWGGSQIYARLVASKARGASSLLRDVYLNSDLPWSLKPTPDPTLPDDVMSMIGQLVETEVQSMQQMGQPIDPGQVRDRIGTLYEAAKKAGVKKARDQAEDAQERVDDILVEGKFYQALAEFIVDLPLFPFACMKGPVVRVVPAVKWVNGKAQIQNIPRMFWYRVSPYDIWWTPGVSNIAEAAVIERQRLTRADLNQLLGLPGYDEDALRGALKDYATTGYVADNTDISANVRSVAESREDPRMNESAMIDMLEYHGYVNGALLIEYGMSKKQIPDPDIDYFVDVFKIGTYIIKVQLNPSVRKRPPYYVTSFEKVPGTVIGNALPDILSDVQDATNAALRTLLNNMAIASGPQVVIDDERVSPNENSDDLYPWKRWHASHDPMSAGSGAPVTFFQPQSNAAELLGIYEKFTQMADDLSAIPRYVTGSERMGGAGRTASGLAMLMGNAAKILQTVAANIDGDVMSPSLSELYDMIMLTDDTGMLRGDESIEVLGVNVAVQRETQRQRQLEFLQITGNPIDMQITGIKGRAAVLRAVSTGIGLDGEDIVPPNDQLPSGAPMMPGGPPGAPGGAPGGPPPMNAGPPQQAQAPAQPPGPGGQGPMPVNTVQ